MAVCEKILIPIQVYIVYYILVQYNWYSTTYTYKEALPQGLKVSLVYGNNMYMSKNVKEVGREGRSYMDSSAILYMYIHYELR